MPECDPLDPSTWPEGYICVQKEGQWVFEEKVQDKKSPHASLIIGGLLGLVIGIMISKR